MHLLLLENRQIIQVCKIIKIGRQENDLYPVSTIYCDSPRMCIPGIFRDASIIV